MTQITTESSLKSTGARSQQNILSSKVKIKNCQPRLLSPAKISFKKNAGEMKIFSLGGFVRSHIMRNTKFLRLKGNDIRQKFGSSGRKEESLKWHAGGWTVVRKRQQSSFRIPASCAEARGLQVILKLTQLQGSSYQDFCETRTGWFESWHENVRDQEQPKQRWKNKNEVEELILVEFKTYSKATGTSQ